MMSACRLACLAVVPRAVRAAVSAPLAWRALSSSSHADFAPQRKAPAAASPAPLRERVETLVKSQKVVLFMKGSPAAPQCGFSQRVVAILRTHGVDIHGVDILSDAALRAFMKEFSEWPTFPQLYINGEFVGGCDIATQLNQSGELGKLLAAGAPKVAA